MQTDPSAPRIGLYFDIDGILATLEATDESSRTFFMREGLVVEAIKTHYLAPGAIELIRWSASHPRLDVHFFSSAVPERNDAFVKALFEKAIPDLEERERCIKSVRVLSKDDLSQNNEGRNLFDEYDISHGNKKKVLPNPSEGQARLENTLLIDDQSNYITYNQVLSLLYVPGFASSHIDLLNEPDLDSRAESKTSANRIFFIAGVIQELLSQVSDTFTARDYIKAHQFKPNVESPLRLTLNYEFCNNLTLYDTGLKALQETSPGLNFLSPDRFRQIVQPPLTPQESQLAASLKANEGEDCVIM